MASFQHERIELLDLYKPGTLHSFEQYRLSNSYTNEVLWPALEFINHLSSDKTPWFLDVASGDGQVGKRVEKKFASKGIPINIFQLDISAFGLEKTSGLKAQAKAYQLPLAAESVDFIHFKDALVHISPDDRKSLFAEFKRVLKAEGQLLVISQTCQLTTLQFHSKAEISAIQKSFENTKQAFQDLYTELDSDPEVTEIHPPYFRTTSDETLKLVWRMGFKIDKSSRWLPKAGEIEWHKIPAQRFVLILKK